MNKKIIIETCVDNFVNTQKSIFFKAERVEVCSSLELGGLCPDLDLCKILIKRKVTPVVMLRNNATFEINNVELEELKEKIKAYRKIGVKEYIFACNIIISQLKKNEKFIFHRAIDEIENYDSNLKFLIKMNFSRVLTAGGKGNAMDNLENLKYLVKKFNNKIKIVVAGKVTMENLQEIEAKTNATEFHEKLKLEGVGKILLTTVSQPILSLIKIGQKLSQVKNNLIAG
uniref:Copper homeostasis protein cutC homolog n=1 Tax=Gouania willdenowi TaxID=441366 RepID=A0A8C5GQU5_GOUWI